MRLWPASVYSDPSMPRSSSSTRGKKIPQRILKGKPGLPATGCEAMEIGKPRELASVAQLAPQSNRRAEGPLALHKRKHERTQGPEARKRRVDGCTSAPASQSGSSPAASKPHRRPSQRSQRTPPQPQRGRLAAPCAWLPRWLLIRLR